MVNYEYYAVARPGSQADSWEVTEGPVLGLMLCCLKIPINFFFKRWGLALWPWLESSGAIIAHCSLELLGSNNPLASASQVAGTTGAYHHRWSMYLFCRDRVSAYCTGLS